MKRVIENNKITLWYIFSFACFLIVTFIVILVGIQNVIIDTVSQDKIEAATQIYDNILLLMMVLTPILLAASGFVTYFLVKRTLKPVYEIANMASDISTSRDLSLRVPVSKNKNEFAHLCETFNAMIAHIEESFIQESQFTSDAAHELRTPISVIISHCEYCLEDLNLEEEVKEEIGIIKAKAQHMSDLVSQLLLIARTEKGTFQPTFEEADLKMIAETVAEELHKKAYARDITIRVESIMSNTKVFCDLGLITTLMINLVENAIRYGSEGGYVKVYLLDNDDEYKIMVSDDGIGIPKENLDKIWNRFYRVDESHTSVEGSGIGLFMVRWVAQLHGGIAEVTSKVGEGSVFSITIPRINK